MKKFNIIFLGRKIGITLTELLVVVIIIAILATLALPMLLKTIEKAKVGEAISNLNLIRTGQKIYFLEWGTFSPDISSLNIENPNDSTSRSFGYTVTGADSTDFTAIAERGKDTSKPAPGDYQGNQYIIKKDGNITGPLI